MATCRNCAHFDYCCDNERTTRFYGKEMAVNDVESFCVTFLEKPKPTKENFKQPQEEKRFIDANAVDYENIMCSQSQLHWLNAIIEKQPTVDAVEVVRCKDCKHYELIPMGGRPMCTKFLGLTLPKEEDFCSYGERKDK